VEKENWALSPREEQVWHLWAQGKTNREIARDLQISVGTVKTYVHRLYFKSWGFRRAPKLRGYLVRLSTKGGLESEHVKG